jgi:hypothetical protein
MGENDIVCVATTENRSEAYSWRRTLEAEGIDCQLGEDLHVWIENMHLAQADVWVHRFNAQRARDILECSVAN